MSERFIEAYVEKLILLEQKTGSNVQYRVMPPLNAPLSDHLAIQSLAKQIAEFIGLSGYSFIIAVAKQKKKVGGHIDLSTAGKEVFIEIDKDTMKFPEAVAATLCHEVCHKWLQVNGIALPVEHENEILTDITSVFLGFGKIMLNGCKAYDVKYETLPNGTRTINQTNTFGYLDREQLAFVYCLVCAMRNIAPSEYLQGLSMDAECSVRKSEQSWGQYFDGRFHRPDKTQETVNAFQGQVDDLQYNMAGLEKHVIYTRKAFCDTADSFLKAGHKKLKSLREKAVAMTREMEPDPVLRFLRTIQREIVVNDLTKELQTVGQESNAILQHARVVGRHFFRNGNRFPPPSPDMFNIVSCPHDGAKLRLPENSGDLIVTCPTCKYRFAYNTAPVSFPEPPAPRKSTWWERSLHLLKRRSKE